MESEPNKHVRSGIVPLMRYSDVGAAIDWLCSAFGFEQHTAAREADGSIYYALLTYGRGMIMVGSEINSELDKLLTNPEEAGASQTCYLVVDDINAHHARVCEAGAEIVLELKSNGAQGYGYSCKDPQGHIWNFGTYDPWHLSGVQAAKVDKISAPNSAWRKHIAIGAVAVLAILTSGLSAAWWTGELSGSQLHAPLAQAFSPGTHSSQTGEVSVAIATAKTNRADAADLASLRNALEQERAAKIEAQQSLQKLQSTDKGGVTRLQDELSVFKQDAAVGSERLSALQRELENALTRAQRGHDQVLQLEDQLEHARSSKIGLASASDEVISQLKSERAEKVALRKSLAGAEQRLTDMQAQVRKLEHQVAAANTPGPQGSAATAPAVAAWNSTGQPESAGTPATATESDKADKPVAKTPKKKRKKTRRKKKRKYVAKKSKPKPPKKPEPSPLGSLFTPY